MTTIIQPPPRTECTCKDCVDCCKEQPGALGPRDYRRIQQHLQLEDKAMAEKFRSSDGALVQDSATNRTFRVRTIVPLYDRRAKRCVFLGADDRCTIHAVKPAGCAMFDTHQKQPEAIARSLWLVREQQDVEYQQLRQTLKVSDHYKPRAF